MRAPVECIYPGQLQTSHYPAVHVFVHGIVF